MNDVERATDFELDSGDLIEVPSCIESLSSSAQQLYKLADEINQYYIKTLLCYGYTSEPNKTSSKSSSFVEDKYKRTRLIKQKIHLDELQNDPDRLKKLMENEETLDSMDSLLSILPLLNDLSLFIERCFATIESTLKRLTYYLNKAANRLPNKHLTTDEEFQLSQDATLGPIFMALMNLIYNIVNLDKVIEMHTNICESLTEFRSICELVIEAQIAFASTIDHEISSISSESLKSLVAFISNIQLTLCNEAQSMFQLCIGHLHRWTIVTDKSQKGYKNLCEHFEKFILFSIENMSDIDHTTYPIKSSMQISKSHQLIHSNLTPNAHLTGNGQIVFGICSLFILYSRIFEKSDKKINQAVMRLLQRPSIINIVHVSGSNSYILLDEFLEKHLASSSLDTKILKQLREKSEQLLRLDFNQTFNKFSVKLMKWLVSLKAEVLATRPSDNDIELLRKRVHLFHYGLNLAEELNSEAKNIMIIYLHYNKPMSKSNLITVLRLIYLIKSIEKNLIQSKLSICYCLIQVEHLARAIWLKLMNTTRKRLISLRQSERRLNTNTALLLTSVCSNFDYLTTYDGRITMILCLSMLIPSFDHNELSELIQLLDILKPDIYERLQTIADCGYLYWSYPTFKTYYNHAFEEDTCALDELNYFHLALNDIPKLFTGNREHCSLDFGWLNARRDEFLKKLGQELMDQFRTEFLDRICHEFELELRLQSHKDLHSDNHSPFKRHLYNFKQIFASARSANTIFTIFNEKISLRYYIEHHLNKTCYNLTSIAPQDWFTYDGMLNLAEHRYELKFANSLLPTQSLDYGLDLVDVTCNLALFVSRYGYDLVNQLFIEKCSNRMSTSSASSTFSGGGMSMLSSFAPTTSNQLLNVLQVKHIEGSLQTHGFGLLDSSVNCTYQVLKRLINLFSRQLTDDKLRAILMREDQRFKQNSKSGTSNKQCLITFEKATKIAKQFKLSLAHPTENQVIGFDLDSLRQSITQIGNLLAFIRMLKSGALNCASKSVEHLPNIDDLSDLKLTKFVRGEFQAYHCETLSKACENFDQCLEDLEENFSPKTDYFNIIINLFMNTLSDKSNFASNAATVNKQDSEDKRSISDPDEYPHTTNKRQVTNDDLGEQSTRTSNLRLDHLRLFFLLVPALTINYIDYIINCKERVSSRSSVARFGALISDDGFPMGVAFLLTVLNQTQDFARLEWFKQVRAKLNLDKNEVKQRIEDSRYEESLKQTSSMTLARLNRLGIEYVALDITISSALLFFRSCALAESR